MALYKKDFEITGGGKMETFLGMAVEQNGKSIKIHLVRGEASVCCNMDQVRYFVRGIAVGTILCDGG